MFPHGFSFRNPWEGTAHPNRDHRNDSSHEGRGAGVFHCTPTANQHQPIHVVDNDIECHRMTPNDHQTCNDDTVVAVATPVYDDELMAHIPHTVAVEASTHSPEELMMRQRAHCVGHLLRTMGRLCFLLSVCEVGVGGAIYSFFDNIHFGTYTTDTTLHEGMHSA